MQLFHCAIVCSLVMVSVFGFNVPILRKYGPMTRTLTMLKETVDEKPVSSPLPAITPADSTTASVVTPEKKEEKKEKKEEKKEKENTLFDDLGVFVENLLDTVEDVVLHTRRYFLTADPQVDPLGVAFSNKIRRKKRVVLVGSGWSAHAFMKICETDGYDVVCVSPRPYFVFTPMLASTSVGLVEYRSIVEPVRVANPLVTYVEAEMTDIDVDRKTIQVNSKFRPDEDIEIAYDYLVYAAGCKVNNMGMKEVDQYCVNMKEVDDVRGIKNKILDAFEQASLPSKIANETEVRRLLSFAIVGAGPVGVEFAGGLSDFLDTELLRLYPYLSKYVTINLISATPSVLNVFDASLQQAALSTLKSRRINVITNSRVTRIADGKLYYRLKKEGEGRARDAKPADKPAEKSDKPEIPDLELDFGLCLWAAGTAPRSLTKVIADRIGDVQKPHVEKTGRLSIDPWCRVEGLPQEVFGSILAMGDAAVCSVTSKKEGPLPQTAQVAAQQGAYVARLFNRRYRIGQLPAPSIPQTAKEMEDDYNASREAPDLSTVAADRDLEYFESLDAALEAPHNWSPGQWIVNHGLALARVRWNTEAKPFNFLNLGQLSYVGGSQAVAQINLGNTEVLQTGGEAANLIWRSVYIVKQVSVRTRILVIFDFFKNSIFGRDMTSL